MCNGSPERREKEIAEGTIAENLPNLMDEINLHVHKAQWTISRINKMIHMATHYNCQKTKNPESSREPTFHIQGILSQTSDFLSETMQDRRDGIFSVLKEKKCQPGILYLAVYSLKMKETLRYSWINKNWDGLLLVHLPYKKH